MKINILTLFPDMFAPLDHSMIKRARQAGIVDITVTNIRDYATDKHSTTDERLYGGGAGMVLKPDVLAAAVKDAVSAPKPRIIVTSPSGRPYTQRTAEELAREEQLIIVCGHYEGIDQRFIDHYATDVISLGDFVLTGGETAALAIADSVTRLLPGALGHEQAALEESFSDGLLEYPQYTRPPVFEEEEVPVVLQNGNHAEIESWRRRRALDITYHNRPELLSTAPLTGTDLEYVGKLRAQEEKSFRLHTALLHYPVYNKKQHIITTSLTNLDLHDIARVSRTYALADYYLIQPIESQRQLMVDLVEHWRSGFGAKYNPDRKEALELVKILPALEDAVEDVRLRWGQKPRIIVTSARLKSGMTSYREMRRIMVEEGGDYLLLFGTGYGLAEEVLEQADYRLAPIYGREGYNHLSVRSAAAIIIDRLLGEL